MKRLPKQLKWLPWFAKGVTELLFPADPICPVCGQERRLRKGLGAKCLGQIMFIHPPQCVKCGKPFRLAADGQKLCRHCSTTSLYFHQARSVALYEGALREYLADLKYRYRPELGHALGELLVEWVKAHPEFRKVDLVIPIPIHPHKLATRGYNQAELLAEPLQVALGMKLENEVLMRVKLTEIQNALNKAERFLNVQEAFSVAKTQSVGGKRILLIDDILTTGATVSEAARCLLKAGARQVNVLTLATGVLEEDWLNPK